MKRKAISGGIIAAVIGAAIINEMFKPHVYLHLYNVKDSSRPIANLSSDYELRIFQATKGLGFSFKVNNYKDAPLQEFKRNSCSEENRDRDGICLITPNEVLEEIHLCIQRCLSDDQCRDDLEEKGRWKEAPPWIPFFNIKTINIYGYSLTNHSKKGTNSIGEVLKKSRDAFVTYFPETRRKKHIKKPALYSRLVAHELGHSFNFNDLSNRDSKVTKNRCSDKDLESSLMVQVGRGFKSKSYCFEYGRCHELISEQCPESVVPKFGMNYSMKEDISEFCEQYADEVESEILPACPAAENSNNHQLPDITDCQYILE